MPDLGTIWFVLVGVLLVGYVVLDGFDLGAGILHLLVARTDDERRTVLNSIGPVWDGNEVWLLTAGGALFAAFPPVYATVFSGFYLALVLLLVALIVRAVSLEFRSKRDDLPWRRGWDVAFAISSFLPALLLGVALGNVVRGVPIEATGDYEGGLIGLLNPFALVVGLLAVAVVSTHGALWLVVKTTGAVADRARGAASLAWIATGVLWVAASALLLLEANGGSDHLAANYGNPIAWLVPVAFVGAWLAGRLLLARPGHELTAFLASGVSIAALLGLVGTAIYPNLLPALGDTSRSLTVTNASSSELTLGVMLVVALIGMPIVIGYTAFVYWSFRGKTRVDQHGY
jgi:cytochrome d ubiquinol oxidase subunit II